jgi:hypothetical protein
LPYLLLASSTVGEEEDKEEDEEEDEEEDTKHGFLTTRGMGVMATGSAAGS